MGFLVLVLAIVFPSRLPAQTVALTFDDGLDPRANAEAASWNADILAALGASGVRAMLFPAGKNVDSPEGMALVQDWSRAGHLIGNHTYAHRNFGSSGMPLGEFTADVLRAEELLATQPTWQPRLRFPYLKEGETAEKRDGLRAWMTARGYASAPVSIDTSDWFYSQRFVAWRKEHPGGDPSVFRDAYLAHLGDRASYYEALAKDVLGRSPAHVMLLHTNAINAAFAADIVAMFRTKGWTVVPPEIAFADPLYSMKPDVLPAGESIVWALAKENGRKDLRYPAEDGEYEESVLRAKGL